MRVFVSEYVCGGAWPEETIVGSLAVEGRAMLRAIVDDLSRIAGVEVETTWDARLGPVPFRGVRTIRAESPAHERQCFERLAKECDATLVIAPEFDGILLERCRIVERAGGRLLGPGSRAVELCSDKLRLAVHLREAGVPTVRTEEFRWDSPPALPAVIKPRDGAGSQDIHFVRDEDELRRLRDEFACQTSPRQFIAQPFVAGRAVSVGLLLQSRREVEILLPAAQHLSDDGRFRYLGGAIPLRQNNTAEIQTTALAACRVIPGLCGYVGVDLIVPDGSPQRPVVVEINPRLTTSYLGYRALAENNLAEWMLIPARFERGIEWRDGVVEFNAAGEAAMCLDPMISNLRDIKSRRVDCE